LRKGNFLNLFEPIGSFAKWGLIPTGGLLQRIEELGVIVHAYNPTTQEVEAEGS
jgi:hypothetical protein